MHEEKELLLQRFAEAEGEEAAGREEAPDAGVQEESPSFDELLKRNPQYKAAYDAKVRKAVEGRFRGMQKREAGDRERLEAILRDAKDLEAREPGFRLRQELRNPGFSRLLAGGTPVEAAFLLAHQDELLLRAMAFAIHHTRSRTVDGIRSGSLRPREGAAGSHTSAPVTPDPRAMNPRERRALRDAVARGQKVYW